MKLTLLGTGTSHGVPVIGCTCRVCTSPFKKDKRLRCSAFIEHEGTAVLIDVGPEFRLQALQCGLRRLDAVLLTHSHADHLHGLDDLRVFSYIKLGGTRQAAEAAAHVLQVTESNGAALPIYANSTTITDVHSRFSYVFEPPKLGGGMPKVQLIDCNAYDGAVPLTIGALSVIPVPMQHGVLPTTGWLLSCIARDGKKHSIAYLTDCSLIPDSSLQLIMQHAGILDHVVIDGLRQKPHATHCSYDEALTYVNELCPQHTWLTHLNHTLRHTEIQHYINRQLHLQQSRYPQLARIVASGGSVAPAYDGLVLLSGE